MRDPDLWARLMAHRFDGAGSSPFSVKLARAQRWSAAFTAQVIEEFRRFLYLTQVSDAQVTPSNTVDAAWHMHLTFTRDYWEELCPNVIGKAVHHQPCAGEEEMPRYRAQFAATRALYEAEFGTAPPPAIWCPRKPMLKRLVLAEAGGIEITSGLLMVVALAMCVAISLSGLPVHWLVYAAILAAAYLLGRVLNGHDKRRRKDGRNEGSVTSGEGGGTAGDGSSSTSTTNGTGLPTKTSTSSSTKGFWDNFFDGGSDGGGGCGGGGD